MGKKRTFFIILIGVILPSLFLPSLILAQGNVSLNIDKIDYSQHPNVTLLVTVRDENGIPIPGLQPADFELVEDGRYSFPPGAVASQFNPDAVVSVMLVLDISGSMRGKPLEELKRAANTFMDRLSDPDKVAIIAFGEEINVDPNQIDEKKEHPFTHDKNAIRNIVNFLEAKGATPLYDALFKAVKITSKEPIGKRAIILMTDGRDERIIDGKVVPDAGSRAAKADDPINEATRYHLPIFTIGLGEAIDRRYLQRIALRTGGTYQETPDPEQLTQLFQNILNILKHQYVLTYKSNLPKDSKPHSILVRVKTPKGEGFDEKKFQIAPPPQETPPPSGPSTIATPTPTPTPGGLKGIVNEITKNVKERRSLVLLITGALLLLLILLIVVIVLLITRRREEEPYPYTEEVYPSSPTERPGVTPPISGASTVKHYPSPGPTMTPPQPPQPVPVPGGTRVIRRVPSHIGLLIVKKDPAKKFDVGEVTNIGRSRNNDVILDNITVSRQHARIKLEGSDFVLYDLGSSNGTFVNGERVVEPRRLKDGDVIRFGEVEMVFKRVT